MRNESRAVVIGGSMAGLVAARVLAERVGQVSIIDRDTLPLTAVNRPVVVAVGSGREGRIRPNRLRARVACRRARTPAHPVR